MQLLQFLRKHYPRELSKLKFEQPKLFKLTSALKIRKGNVSFPKNYEKFLLLYEFKRSGIVSEKEFKRHFLSLKPGKGVLIRANFERGEIIYYSFPSFEDIIYVLRKFSEFHRG